MSGSKSTKRDDVLHAAARIVRSKSVSHLTLDAVAKEAGVSKGGLLHHFASKDILIQEMINAPMDHYAEEMKERIENDRDQKGKWSRAYLIETFKQLEDEKELWSAGLLAALATNPALLDPLKEHFHEWQQNIENDGIDAVHATIIRLAADGLWFLELFGFHILSDDLREKVLNQLIESSSNTDEVSSTL
jgi:AcrR family transcriptional regulator